MCRSDDTSSAEEAQWKLHWKFGLTKSYSRDDEVSLNLSELDSPAEITPLIVFFISVGVFSVSALSFILNWPRFCSQRDRSSNPPTEQHRSTTLWQQHQCKQEQLYSALALPRPRLIRR